MSAAAELRLLVAGTLDQIGDQVIARGPRVANALRNAELEVLAGQRSGRVYKKARVTKKRKKKKGKGSYIVHTASRPGEPPAVRSGNLRRNWSERIIPGARSVTVQFHADERYAPFLEHGTSRMAARPFAERILEKAEPEVMQIMGAPYHN